MEQKKGTMLERTLYSKELEEEVKLMIYTPANFSPLYKYHLLIAQDGQDYFSLGRIGRIADELLEGKEIQNLIIVGIPYLDVQDRREKYHPNGSKNASYIRFLGQELVPFLDKEFPSYQMGMGRGLIGDSLAGTVSLMTALSYPNTFGKVIIQSPFVNEDVLQKVEQFETPHLLTVYHVVGTEERKVPTTDGKTKDFVEPNLKLHELMKQKQFPHHFEQFNGDHTWTHWQPNLKTALRSMY
ncbi:alpha/beta hydrolase [Sutcliffiella sp. NC1]|uniref:alpha/beta hydrolase n=1 Tax=Sutcliffiella sp. NC1 TaxID=3004096 RepID=UPI0022DE7E6E|nr:esterase family protein [Sutcliffiella sp. NC1]WBL16330.1 esterase family protein [Sutcliffiella sp. NC1]